jgi:uncharacterized membrane-anchored protein YitT (DUF2179 family)
MKRRLSELLNAGLIVLGILSAAMGLKGFLLPSNFIDGGVTGVSLLLVKTSGLPLSVWLPLVNLHLLSSGIARWGGRSPCGARLRSRASPWCSPSFPTLT